MYKKTRCFASLKEGKIMGSFIIDIYNSYFQYNEADIFCIDFLQGLYQELWMFGADAGAMEDEDPFL